MNEQKKRQLLEDDRTYVWHPFTQMKDYAEIDHLLIERAEGIYLYDPDGKSYADTVSSWWINVHGHGHPRIQKAITEQFAKIDHIMFSGITHEPGITLAKKIVEITPQGLSRVFYSDNGSTAVEVALKMSYQYWQHRGQKSKNTFAFLDHSYHGDTLGAVSVGGVDMYHRLFKPLLFPAMRVDSPGAVPVEQALTALENLFKQHHEQLCGLIIEPIVQAAGGMLTYSSEYVQKARQLCGQYGIHLIADEVATGFGRTGTMFACEQAGITPDLMCLSKGLTAGILPMSITLSTEDIYQAFYDDYETMKTFFHGHSFTANPIAASVALESLNIFEDEQVMAHVHEISPYLQEKFGQFAQYPHIADTRGIGMMAAMDIYQDPATKTRFDFRERMGYQVYLEGLKEGLILRPLSDTIYYWLPLCITREQLDDILAKTHRVLERMEAIWSTH